MVVGLRVWRPAPAWGCERPWRTQPPAEDVCPQGGDTQRVAVLDPWFLEVLAAVPCLSTFVHPVSEASVQQLPWEALLFWARVCFSSPGSGGGHESRHLTFPMAPPAPAPRDSMINYNMQMAHLKNQSRQGGLIHYSGLEVCAQNS